LEVDDGHAAGREYGSDGPDEKLVHGKRSGKNDPEQIERDHAYAYEKCHFENSSTCSITSYIENRHRGAVVRRLGQGDAWTS
jgi:hypothetical protein